MNELGENNRNRLLEQLRRFPNMYTNEQLADAIAMYSDLELSHFKGVIPDSKYFEVEGMVSAAEWGKIEKMPTDTVDEIQYVFNRISDFTNAYPSQQNKAQNLIDKLQNKRQKLVEEQANAQANAQAQREQADWANVNFDSNSELHRYLRKYPNSIHKDEVEDYIWENAQRGQSTTSLQEYLHDYPNGKYSEEATYSKEFLEKRSEIEKDSEGVITANFYRKKFGILNPLLKKADELYQELRNATLEKMKNKPSEYTRFDVDKLIAGGVFSEDELIDEKLLLDTTVDSDLLPNLKTIVQEKQEQTSSQDDDCTDIFLFGIPSSGKTCLLMGLIASDGQEGYEINFAKGAYKYAAALKKYVKAGIVPGRTETDFVAAISGKSIEYTSKKTITHHFNLIEMAGEQFSRNIVNEENKNMTQDFDSMGLGVTDILNKDNRKCFLFIVDCTTKILNYKWQEEYIDANGQAKTRQRKEPIDQEEMLTRFMDMCKLPTNQKIMSMVDSIHIVVTKSDTLVAASERQNYDLILKKAREHVVSNYGPVIARLSNYCKATGRINVATDFVPHVFAFSLGRFYIGDVYKYHAHSTLKIMDSLKAITCGVKAPTKWDKITAWFNKPIF